MSFSLENKDKIWNNNNIIIKKDETKEMNNFEFYSAVNTTLNIIIENIEQDKFFQKDYSSRIGSILFEENLKKEINKNKENIINNVNKLFKDISCDLQLESIRVEDKTDNKSYYDMLLIFEDDLEEIYTAPINIKISSGKTKETICEWKGLSSALYPNITLDNINKIKFYQIAKDRKITDEISDYFIWIFNKNDEKEMLNNHKCLSLLSINKEDIYISSTNLLQIHTRTCRKLKDFDIAAERKLLLSKLLTKMLKDYEQEIISISESLKNVSK